MLNTVLFDMGGTLEDIWYNDETITDVMVKVRAVLEREGLDPACSQEEFRERVLAGVKDYKRWSEGNMLEDKPENIWPALSPRSWPTSGRSPTITGSCAPA